MKILIKGKTGQFERRICPVKRNIKHKDLIAIRKLLQLPHIKLALAENSVKALDGPQIKKVLRDEIFENSISDTEKAAWN